jgi:pimeloyl-ACP methyl ester carboxylesterase
VRARLKVGNLAPVRYRDPTTGEWRSEVPEFGHLAVLLRLYAYQPQAAAMLPLLLHDASQGHYENLLAQSRMIHANVSDAIMHGMQLSVMCSEDDADLHVDPADADRVIGSDFIAVAKAQCAVWPKGVRATDFRKPLTGTLPVLAISGEFDPVTPPRYADEVTRSLPNGRHLVLPGQGHSVLGIGCMPKLFAQFVEAADAKVLDAACLKRLKPTPPFAGAYGWEP